MRILGIGHFVVHDSSVAELSDCGIDFAVSEERLTRHKHDGAFPHRALRIVKGTSFDIVAAPYSDVERFEKEHRETSEWKRRDRVQGMQRRNERALREAGVTHFMGHHASHAAGAYYLSGFDHAFVLTYDGGINSEPWLSTVWRASPEGLTPLRSLTQRDGATAAIRYSAITSLLGFRPIQDEGKVTGLAARGEASEEIIQRLSQAFLDVPTLVDYYNGSFAERFRWLRGIYSDADLASSIQAMTEESVLQLILECGINPTDTDCVLSGGLFANVTLNLKIKRLGFKRLFVYPAMGDEGLSVGCTAAVALSHGLSRHQLDHVFLGPAFDEAEIQALLEATGLPYRRVEDVESYTAAKLAEGKTVCRFAGACEFGPRALGNRSILSPATEPSQADHLNKRLKRTDTMPFAPVTTEELAPSLFTELSGLERCTAFMTTVVPCTALMKRSTPGAVHVDGTARPQIVRAAENPAIHRIVSQYYRLTGYPALINTSFNMHGEPIVCTPADAIQSFIDSRLDCLTLGNFIVESRTRRPWIGL